MKDINHTFNQAVQMSIQFKIFDDDMLGDITNLVLVFQNIRPGAIVVGKLRKEKRNLVNLFLINQFQLFYTEIQKHKDFSIFITSKHQQFNFSNDIEVGLTLGYPIQMNIDPHNPDLNNLLTFSVYSQAFSGQQQQYSFILAVRFKKNDFLKVFNWFKKLQSKFNKFNQCSFLNELFFCVDQNSTLDRISNNW